MSLPMKHPSSFRDKSGFVYEENDQILRTVNFNFKEDFDFFVRSGLYSDLVEKGLLISHQEQEKKIIDFGTDVYKVLKPQKIPFISYPYEWSTSMLLKAGFLTLEIEKIALDHDMTLKDASAYNIQFIGTKAIFIDSLSSMKSK